MTKVPMQCPDCHGSGLLNNGGAVTIEGEGTFMGVRCRYCEGKRFVLVTIEGLKEY